MTGDVRQARRKRQIQVTGFLEKERILIEQKVKQLGGSFLSSKIFILYATHIICDSVSRKEKFVCGCASGKWMLTVDYINESYKAGTWLDEEDFEWTVDKVDNPLLRPIAALPRQWRLHILKRKQKPFCTWTVLLIMSPEKKLMFKRLLEAGGAKILNGKMPWKGETLRALTFAFIDDGFKKESSFLSQAKVPVLQPKYIIDFLIEAQTQVVTPFQNTPAVVIQPKVAKSSLKLRAALKDVNQCYRKQVTITDLWTKPSKQEGVVKVFEDSKLCSENGMSESSTEVIHDDCVPNEDVAIISSEKNTGKIVSASDQISSINDGFLDSKVTSLVAPRKGAAVVGQDTYFGLPGRGSFSLEEAPKTRKRKSIEPEFCHKDHDIDNGPKRIRNPTDCVVLKSHDVKSPVGYSQLIGRVREKILLKLNELDTEKTGIQNINSEGNLTENDNKTNNEFTIEEDVVPTVKIIEPRTETALINGIESHSPCSAKVADVMISSNSCPLCDFARSDLAPEFPPLLSDSAGGLTQCLTGLESTTLHRVLDGKETETSRKPSTLPLLSKEENVDFHIEGNVSETNFCQSNHEPNIGSRIGRSSCFSDFVIEKRGKDAGIPSEILCISDDSGFSLKGGQDNALNLGGIASTRSITTRSKNKLLEAKLVSLPLPDAGGTLCQDSNVASKGIPQKTIPQQKAKLSLGRRQMSAYLTSMIEGLLQEKDYHQGLELCKRFVHNDRYPSPSVLRHILWIVKNGISTTVTAKAINLLQCFKELHPPSAIPSIYSAAFETTITQEVDGSYITGPPWDVIWITLRKTQQLSQDSVDDSTSDRDLASLQLLRFVLACFKEDLSQFRFSDQVSRCCKGKPLIWQFIWGDKNCDTHSSNLQDVVDMWINSLSETSKVPLLTPMIKMVADCCSLYDCQASSSVYGAACGDLVALIANSINCNRGTNERFLFCKSLFRELTDHWLAMRLADHFLGFYDVTSLENGFRIYLQRPLSLEKVLKCYCKLYPSGNSISPNHKQSSLVESDKFNLRSQVVVQGYLESQPNKKITSSKINKRNVKGETKLHVACIKNQPDKVRELLSLGADPNSTDNAGWTPLHEACNHGYLLCVEELLKSKDTDILVAGPNGLSVLHDAVLNDRVKVVKLLMTIGGQELLDQRTSKGLTVFEMCHSSEMSQLLKQPVHQDVVARKLERTILPDHAIEQHVLLIGTLISTCYHHLEIPSDSEVVWERKRLMSEFKERMQMICSRKQFRKFSSRIAILERLIIK